MQGRGIGFRVAMGPGKRRALPDTPEGRVDDLIETAKAHFRAKVQHPFRVINRQFGFQKTRLRGMLLPRPQAECGGATRTAAKCMCWRPSPTCSWRGMNCYAQHDEWSGVSICGKQRLK
jgi:hypothetical protein